MIDLETLSQEKDWHLEQRQSFFMLVDFLQISLPVQAQAEYYNQCRKW